MKGQERLSIVGKEVLKCAMEIKDVLLIETLKNNIHIRSNGSQLDQFTWKLENCTIKVNRVLVLFIYYLIFDRNIKSNEIGIEK